MTNLTVSLETAKAMAEAGYPQDQWGIAGQHVYLIEVEDWSDWKDDIGSLLYRESSPNPNSGWVKWYAAPSHLQAFEWCCGKGYYWRVRYDGVWGAMVFGEWESKEYVSPDALLLAILEYMKERKDG